MQTILKTIIFTVLLTTIYACDDGDIILDEDINFDTNSLDFCNINNDEGITQSTVFFNINNQTNEVLSFEINNGSFIPTQESVEASEIRPVEQLNLSLRDFDSSVTSNYFCSGIPDASIQILSELVGNSGNIQIQTRNITTLDGDDDRDGLTNQEEGFNIAVIANPEEFADGMITIGTDLSVFLDSDEDGIPDFQDRDDDNDNVFTEDELDIDDESGLVIIRDTDEDTIPDYLDTDDDNDGVPTRNEISEEGPFPNNGVNQNPDGLANFLNDQITNDMMATSLISNTFRNTFRTSVIGLFVGLSDGSATITRDLLRFGEFDVSEEEATEEIIIEAEEEEIEETPSTETVTETESL